MMIRCVVRVGRHSADHGLDGFVTAWTGDLNPGFPTQPLPLSTPQPTPAVEPVAPDLSLLRRVLHVTRCGMSKTVSDEAGFR